MSPSAAPATFRAVLTIVGPRSSRPADAPSRPSFTVETTATTIGRDTSRADAGSWASAASTVRSISSVPGTTEPSATRADARGGTTTTKTATTIATRARSATAAARPRGMNASRVSTNRQDEVRDEAADGERQERRPRAGDDGPRSSDDCGDQDRSPERGRRDARQPGPEVRPRDLRPPPGGTSIGHLPGSVSPGSSGHAAIPHVCDVDGRPAAGHRSCGSEGVAPRTTSPSA